MQLVNQLLNGTSTQSQSSTDPSLTDLTGLESGDQLELSDDRDTDSDTDDDDASALALAALLPGLTNLTPTTPTGNTAAGTASGAGTGGDSVGVGGVDALAKRADLDATQAALDQLAGDAKSDATDLSAGARTDSATATASSGAQNATAAPPAQLHALMTAHTTSGDVDVTPDATLRAPVGTHAWKDELGTQLTWMALNGREAASLRLSPEHLGPIEVRISTNDAGASVYFGASNPDTRSALEQSLPRLREMFASNGLLLADAGVSRDAPRNAFKPSPQSSGVRGVSDASSEVSVKSITLARVGLVDTYV
jgi:flagellar hook-length control protein FliK